MIQIFLILYTDTIGIKNKADYTRNEKRKCIKKDTLFVNLSD